MPLRSQFPFTPVNSTAPSFESTLGSTSQFYALQSSAVNRLWNGPSGRAVRFAESSGVDYYLNWGTTLAVAASSDSILMLGGVESVLTPPTPSVTHVAIAGKSTDVVVNLTIGYGY